jgi:hypothetical protein
MYKPNNKKMLTVLITVAMVFSALAVLSIVAQPAYAQTASGTVTYFPDIITTGQLSEVSPFTPVIYANGGTFSGVTELYFFWSTSNSLSGLQTSSASFTYKPTAGSTTFTNALLTPTGVGVTTATAGEILYLLVSPSNTLSSSSTGVSVMGSSPFTVSQYNPAITVSPTTAPAGSKVLISGVSGDTFNPASTTATVYLASDGSSSISLGTIGLSDGTVLPRQYVVMPNDLPYGAYDIYAVDSISGENAATSVTLSEAITVTPSDISGSISSTFTINGFGFPAGATIASGSTEVLVGSAGAIQTGVTVSSDGEFTLSVSGLTSSLSATPGPYPIAITITNPSSTVSFPNAIYVSVPLLSTTVNVYDISGSSPATSGYGGDLMEIVGWGFAASATGSVYFDGATFSVTSDANGFFLVKGATVTVPNVESGVYKIIAAVGGITAYTSFNVLSNTYILDSSFSPLNGEYASSGSTVYVVLTGQVPYEAFDAVDTGLATVYPTLGGDLGLTNYYLGIVTVNDGTFNATTQEFYANGAGYLNISYSLDYFAHDSPTSTSYSITVTHGTHTVISANYLTVETAYDGFPSSGTSLLSETGTASPGGTVTINFATSLPTSHFVIIPSGALTTPQAAGFSGPYSVYFDSTLLTLTSSGKTTFTSSVSSITFTVPSTATSGVHTITIYGASTSTGKTSISQPIYMNPEFIVSTPSSGATVVVNSVYTSTTGGSGTSSSPFTAYADNNSLMYDVQFDLYDFPALTPIYVTVQGTNPTGAFSTTVTTDSVGAASYTFEFPATVGGIPYQISFSSSSSVLTKSIPITGSVWYYETTPAVALDPSPFADNGGVPATDYFGYYGANATAGSSIPIYAVGLLPNAIYNIYVSTSASFNASDFSSYFVTNSVGNASFTYTLSYYLASGSYYLDIAPASSSSTSTSLYLTVEVDQLIPAFAFPGEAAPVSITLASAPHSGTVYYDVQAMENGSLFQSLQVPYTTGSQTTPLYYLNFSFTMPNGVPGTYFQISFQYEPVFTSSLVGSSGSSTVTGIGPAATFSLPYYTTLVSGSGALVVAISASQIATIITGAVNSAMKVPLSELNAEITSLNGTVVTLKTSVGTMTTTLSTINATVASIESGQVVVMTKLGSIETSLASLNASLVAFNGNVVSINTTLGQVQTSLSSIGGQVTANANGIATIKTDLGTIQGQIVSTNGNISTIHTALGNLTAVVGKINTNTSGFSTLEIFLIVAIVLILITLVIAFLAVSNTNKLAKKIEEQKKQ